MSLSLSGINQNNQNFFVNNKGLASGQELNQIVNEIFSTASAQSAKQVAPAQENIQINWEKLNNADSKVKVFGLEGLNSQTVKQIANNQAGYDISLSQKALADIGALRAQAAQTQVVSLAKNMDGKVYAPAPMQTSDVKEALAPKRTFDFVNIQNMNKDKKGSNPFFLNSARKNNNEESEKALNLFV